MELKRFGPATREAGGGGVANSGAGRTECENFSFVGASYFLFFCVFPFGGWGSCYDRLDRYVAREMVIQTVHHCCFGTGGAASMGLQPACGGIEIPDYTHSEGSPIMTVMPAWDGIWPCIKTIPLLPWPFGPHETRLIN